MTDKVEVIQAVTVELLLCPLCSSRDAHVDDCPVAGGEDWNRRYGVVCKDCGASSGWYNTEAEAVTAWSTRTQAVQSSAGEVERLREALDDVLNTSGARGTYHSLKYSEAVERAEGLLKALTPDNRS